MKFKGLFFYIFFCISIFTFSQNHSVARKWNEVILQSIRNDLARPTVHARNLFHLSAAMYDAWAIVNEQGSPYLIGNNLNGFNSEFDTFSNTLNHQHQKQGRKQSQHI